MPHLYAFLVSVAQVLAIIIFVEYHSHRFSGQMLVVLGLVQWVLFPLIAAAIFWPLPHTFGMPLILSALTTITAVALCHFHEDRLLSRFHKR